MAPVDPRGYAPIHSNQEGQVRMAQPTGGFLLVLYCSAGGGHRRVGQAIAEEWRDRTGGRVDLVNYFARFVNPVWDAITTLGYFQVVKHAPRACGAFYDLMGRLRPDSRFRRSINRTGKGRFARYLARERPDVVCCVHWTFAGTMSELRREGRSAAPCLTVITDYVSHAEWLHPHVDRYCVPHALMRDGLLAHGIPAERIVVSGMPIRRQFQEPRDRDAARARLGLAPGVPVVLVMAGAYAVLGSVGDIVRVLARFPQPIQAVVVCGHAPRLADRCRAAAARSPHRFQVFGYVDNIAELMAVSDLLITKAGGVTVSEALAMHLPMLVYGSIPGQEERNTEFLVAHGAALAPGTPAEVHQALASLLAHPERLVEMRRAAAALGRTDAARVVVANLIELAGGTDVATAGRSYAAYPAPR
jgi:processive 1,2-diacylglycerol beta-glucosyltransferase